MVLLTKKGNLLPAEAVALSKEDAIAYQRKFIKNWPAQHEVFFIKYGGYITAGSAVISSYLIFNKFKRTFNLKTSPRTLFTKLPSILLPAAFSPFLTEKVLTEKILLMQFSCPLCQQVTFGCSQLYISILYPALYSYVSLSSIAFHFNSCYIPDIRTQPKEYWNTAVKIFKKSGRTFGVVGLIQSVVILMLPFLQNKELVNIVSKSKENYYFEDSYDVGKVENKL